MQADDGKLLEETNVFVFSCEPQTDSSFVRTRSCQAPSSCHHYIPLHSTTLHYITLHDMTVSNIASFSVFVTSSSSPVRPSLCRKRSLAFLEAVIHAEIVPMLCFQGKITIERGKSSKAKFTSCSYHDGLRPPGGWTSEICRPAVTAEGDGQCRFCFAWIPTC